MSPVTMGIIGICILLVLLFLKMPIGFAMGLVGFVGYWWVRDMSPALSMISLVTYSEATAYMMSALPLFIFMGWLAAYGELSKDAFSALHRWVGHWRGGLSMSTVIACAAFGAVCGSSMATAVTMVPVALPEMRKYKYDDELSLGCIAAGGNLGFLIPPSLAFIIYAILTEESIGALFMAGILPGLLLTFLFSVTIYVLCRINPQLGPSGPRASWRERLVALKGMWGIIVLFILVMGGIYGGFFTPTEAAAVGAFGALVLGLVNRQLTWRRFITTLLETGKTTAMVFVLIIGAIIFSRFMTISTIPVNLARFIGALTIPDYAILAAILMLYVLVGFFMEIISVLVITIPIFYPVILAMGFDPVWFGVLAVLTMLMGSISPPFGILVFAVAGMVKEVPIFRIFKGAMPFLVAMFVCLIILVAFPQISLLLPHLMLPYR